MPIGILIALAIILVPTLVIGTSHYKSELYERTGAYISATIMIMIAIDMIIVYFGKFYYISKSY
jgi:hypothetical protein